MKPSRASRLGLLSKYEMRRKKDARSVQSEAFKMMLSYLTRLKWRYIRGIYMMESDRAMEFQGMPHYNMADHKPRSSNLSQTLENYTLYSVNDNRLM